MARVSQKTMCCAFITSKSRMIETWSRVVFHSVTTFFGGIVSNQSLAVMDG